MEQIKNSILGLADLDSLEPIQHFKYPPWNRDTPYTVEISDLPKDKAALAYYKSLGKGICIYTDASAIPDDVSTGIGVGLAAYCLDNSESTQSRPNLDLY